MALFATFLEIFGRPTTWGVMIGVIKLLVPVWLAFLCGVMLGWAWKPRRGSLGKSEFNISAPSSPSAKAKVLCFSSSASNNVVDREQTASSGCNDDACRKEDDALVTDDDLEYLCHLVEKKDGGPPWKHMMDHSTQTMSYQAWQREPKDGPPQYCSRTVYEDATPELMRDFFWDDEFRMKWDNMLVHAEILEECPSRGTMMVHWIRKFPFFCSDREYIIGRRMWGLGRSYYCVTKGVPCSSVPRKEKPRRVDLYYSSWFIQAVESRKGNGQSPACEVILFHYEDMGIPWEVAKFGVRQGMWGAVKNIERGFRAYQKHRPSGAPLTHHALMAQTYTKLDRDYLKVLEGSEGGSSETQLAASADEKPKGVHIPKLLIIGGAILVACSIDHGLLTKTLVYGVARRFGNIGRRGFLAAS